MTIKHPGKIVFVDRDQDSEQVKAYTEVSSSIAFVKHKDQTIPVVRVEKQTRGDEIIIRSYGPEGQFLTSTRGLAKQ